MTGCSHVAQNLDLVRSVYETQYRQDLDGFTGDFHPQIEWRFAVSFIYGEVNPIIGHDNVRAGSLRRLAGEWINFDGELAELLDAGDEIVGLGHYVGTNKATGRKLRAQFAHFWTVKDGKIVRWRQYTDTLQLAQVAGLRSLRERIQQSEPRFPSSIA